MRVPLGVLIPLCSVGSAFLALVLSYWYQRRAKNHAHDKRDRLVSRVSSLVFPYARRATYSVSLLWAVAVYYFVSSTTPTVAVAVSSLMRIFAFTALGLVFAALIPGLISVYLPGFPLLPLFVRARRSVGVSMFFFGLIHASVGFVFNLSGSVGSLAYLSLRHQAAVALGGIGLFIFSLLAATSFDVVVKRMGYKAWKMLHRFVYIGILLILVHAFFIGSHFTKADGVIPVVTNYFALLFLLLEIVATGIRWRRSRVPTGFDVRYAFLGIILVAGVFISSTAITKGGYDPHARHRRGYSKDFAVNVESTPKEIRPGEPATLRFRVMDKRSQRPVTKFQVVQEKLMHVIVLRSDLSTYDHIHPEYQGNGEFTVITVFPKKGLYRLYIEYSPPNFIENLSVVEIRTAGADRPEAAVLTPGQYKKVFDNHQEVSLAPITPVRLNDTVDFSFTVFDKEAEKPVRDLEPYLGAFGHLAIVSEDGQTYSHVHPIDVPLSQNDRGGPTVRFSTFFQKKGKYKLFCQFRRGGKIFVTDFVIEAL